MAVETTTPRSRRHILAAGLGALGAFVAAAIGRPSAARALDGEPLLIGAANTGTIETSLENTDSAEVTFRAIQGAGTALRGETSGGTAVHGQDAGSGTGVSASSVSGSGVVAISGSGQGVEAGSNSTAIRGSSNDDTPTTFPDGSYRSGVIGSVGDIGTAGDPGAIAPNTDEVGVYGFSDISGNSTGVWGDTWDGVGVFGTGTYGVLGIGESYGVYAQTAQPSGGYALYTKGPIIFYGRSGRAYVPSGRSYKDVTIPGMNANAAVIATLLSNRPGFYVQSAVASAGKFRLNLNKTATATTWFAYLVIGS